MRTCFFCQSSKLTREHIWPDWIVELFPHGHKWRGGIDDTTGRRIRMTPTSLTHKAKCACGKCNHGWMSDIEGITIPILKPLILSGGEPRIFPSRHQRILAQWMTLRSMVFESQVSERQHYYTQQEREAFAKDRSLEYLSNIHVWLAPFPGAHLGAAFFMQTHSAPAKNSGLQVITCHVGQIAIQFVAWKRFGASVSEFIDKLAATEWPQSTVQIWPCPAGELLWPPYLSLSPAGFQSLANRFALDVKFRVR